jgi:hypothetical protein
MLSPIGFVPKQAYTRRREHLAPVVGLKPPLCDWWRDDLKKLQSWIWFEFEVIFHDINQ